MQLPAGLPRNPVEQHGGGLAVDVRCRCERLSPLPGCVSRRDCRAHDAAQHVDLELLARRPRQQLPGPVDFHPPLAHAQPQGAARDMQLELRADIARRAGGRLDLVSGADAAFIVQVDRAGSQHDPPRPFHHPLRLPQPDEGMRHHRARAPRCRRPACAAARQSPANHAPRSSAPSRHLTRVPREPMTRSTVATCAWVEVPIPLQQQRNRRHSSRPRPRASRSCRDVLQSSRETPQSPPSVPADRRPRAARCAAPPRESATRQGLGHSDDPAIAVPCSYPGLRPSAPVNSSDATANSEMAA